MHDLTQWVRDALTEQYDIERQVGHGGMAVVYLARERSLNRQVAVKVLEPQVATEVARERFLREVDFASRLTHPNIVPIFHAGEAQDLLYYVMPYIEGHSLRTRLAREGRIPFDDTLQIVAEVADALHYAHSQGVIHRDIKPENILLADGHAMVADFGIARAVCVACNENLTIAGLPIGTPGYMSPEQGAGEEVDARADVYSLGAMTFEMLSGQTPFPGDTIEAVIAARYTQPTPRLRDVGWTLSPVVDDAVHRAMQLDRDRRFPTARDFLDAIRPRISAENLEVTLPTQGAAGTPPGPEGTAEPERSVAVLPFANLSGDPDNEYFSEGITDDIIAQLSLIRDLRVTSRTSILRYRKTDKPIGEIARELGVGTVLEGSVRRAGNRVRVLAQLIDAAHDRHIWTERYDRELTDIFAIQDEIAEHIAEALKTHLTPDEKTQLARKPTDDLNAYNLYLKGRFHWSTFAPDGIERAVEYFDAAIALDPGYALAHAGLADCHLIRALTLGIAAPQDAMPRARDAARRALERDPGLADAHATLAAVHDWYEWDWHRAETALNQALTLAPHEEKPLIVRSFHLSAVGRLDEALAADREAEQLCPASVVAATNVALHLFHARRYEEALRQIERVLAMDPDFPSAHIVRTWTYLLIGATDLALEAARRAADLIGNTPPRTAAIAAVLAAHGDAPRAAEVLDELLARRAGTDEYVSALDLALVSAWLERVDEAFRWLEIAIEERAPWLTHLHVDPVWDPVRSDLRFEEIEARIGMPILHDGLPNPT